MRRGDFDKEAVAQALKHSERERRDYFRAIQEPKEESRKTREKFFVHVGDFAMGFLVALLVCLLLGIGGAITGR